MRYGTCDFCKRQANINHYRGPKNADVDDGEYGDLLSGEEVARLFNVSRDTLERWVAEGEFPAPLSVGKQAKCWDWQSVAYYRLRLAMSARLVAEKQTASRG